MPSTSETVILLHGLARSDKSMGKIARALEAEGYGVVNRSYASRSGTVEKLANEAIEAALAEAPAVGPIHFVTHSLGGILVRQYLSRHALPRLGKVVMLGPPNQGSEVVDRLREFPGFRFVHGEAGLELGTGPGSVARRLGEVNFDLGVIAGTRSINLFLSSMIPGENDGKVSVANTQVEGMNDHLAMEVTHTFMMRNNRVIEQVVHYLRHGKFKRD